MLAADAGSFGHLIMRLPDAAPGGNVQRPRRLFTVTVVMVRRVARQVQRDQPDVGSTVFGVHPDDMLMPL